VFCAIRIATELTDNVKVLNGKLLSPAAAGLRLNTASSTLPICKEPSVGCVVPGDAEAAAALPDVEIAIDQAIAPCRRAHHGIGELPGQAVDCLANLLEVLVDLGEGRPLGLPRFPLGWMVSRSIR
jgi:hypothetical protein